MSWMESRRIRRVRKPTRWELWVAQWHEWLQDALEKAVCCGVDPATAADVMEAARFPLGSKQASAAFSIRSLSAYRDDSDFGDYEDDSTSETDSESGDFDHTIDMEARDSTVDCDEVERTKSVSSEYIPFDDEYDLREQELVEEPKKTSNDEEQCGRSQQSEPHGSGGGCRECALLEDRLYHRALFNCVLVELLSTRHPAVLWTWN